MNSCNTDIIALLQQFTPVFIVLAVFDGVLKVISLWHSARRNQLAWFICLAVFNTLGILPIIYLLINKGKKEE
ncbi:MAG: DUF5652 family protein [Dysgonamonadaceae bacterium]|jgi:hypothetical protein|nr:DUF5652 family protein [Dysgonamonadaceae bacterium]